MPNTLKEEFKKLKDEIYKYKEQDDNQDFIKLLQIKSVNDELKETLILLHSNYTTEIRETRNHYCRLFNKMIDREIELLELIIKMLENDGSITSNNESNTKPGLVSKIESAGGLLGYLQHLPRIWMWIAIVIVAMTGLHHFVPDSFERSVKLFKNVFSLGLFANDNKSNNNPPPPYYYYPQNGQSPYPYPPGVTPPKPGAPLQNNGM